MPALKRRDGIVWITTHGVIFPMRADGKKVTCVQTIAGLEKITGRKIFTQEQMRTIFHANRQDLEQLARLLYESNEGDVLTITLLPTTAEPVDFEHRG